MAGGKETMTFYDNMALIQIYHFHREDLEREGTADLLSPFQMS